MKKSTYIERAKNEILAHFQAQTQKIYTKRELAQALSHGRRLWRLALDTTLDNFIAFLERDGAVVKHTFRSPKYPQRTITRYAFKNPSALELAISLKSRAYLCHRTAAALHGLVQDDLKEIYMNVEQSEKPSPSGGLTQRGLKLAFNGKQRQSTLSYEHQGKSIIQLAGKNTARYGVEEVVGPTGETLHATTIARTLIDLVVRPAYAGGTHEILKAFCVARDKVSAEDLLSVLKRLDYRYPYEQSIGFLMERAGHSPTSFAKLRTAKLKFDFYLDYGMKQPAYSKEWRLYYPKDMQQS